MKVLWLIITIYAIFISVDVVGSDEKKETRVNQDHIIAHKRSIYHKREIINSEICGCFYCKKIFPPSEIEEWTDTSKPEAEHTAFCPYCGIDSVIGSKSGYPITEKFLSRMNKHWFSIK
jgi:hypothetical protein